MTEDHTEETRNQEVEVHLTVKLPHEPGKIDFPVSSYTTIGEIFETLSNLPVTQQNSNFGLALDNEVLGDALPLSEFVDLAADKPSLTLVLKQLAYNEKLAREHISKVREIASLQLPAYFSPMNDASGVDAGASKLFELKFAEAKLEEKNENEEAEEPESPPHVTLTEEEKARVVAGVQSARDPIRLSDFSGSIPFTASPALKSLNLSAWSPVSVSNKAKGDLLYLSSQTIEGETFHITSHVSGFFVNNSSNTKFDRSPKQVSTTNGKQKFLKDHSLLALLEQLSPLFLQTRVKNATGYSSIPVESFAVPSNGFLSNPWLVQKPSKPQPDLGRSQSNFLQGGMDGADLQRDWNEEYQSTRELPKTTFQERIVRERLLNRAGFDFATSAVRGAAAVVRGEIEAINPAEDPSQYIYLRNGIFYSLCVDAGQYVESGGDLAARAAANKDLAGIRCLNRLDLPEVYHLCTVIVDFCGRRVICQTPVPGIFNENLSSENDGVDESKPFVVYGYDDDQKVLRNDEAFGKKLKPVADAFHLKPHHAWTRGGESSAEVATSAEIKGMKGNDGRSYVIELYRTTPLDISFIENHYNPESETSYPHREVTLRHEAVEEWWRRQIGYAVKTETERLEAEGSKAQEGEEAEKPNIVIDQTQFTFNPDVFSLNTPKEAPEEIKADEAKVREISKFVSEVLIPEFVKELENDEAVSPIDGEHLTTLLHKAGINVRYLGQVAEHVTKRMADLQSKQLERKLEIAEHNKKVDEEEKEKAKKAAEEENSEKETSDKESSETPKSEEATSEPSTESTAVDYIAHLASLQTLRMLLIQEMIARSAKFILREATLSLPFVFSPYVVAHFANCLLGRKLNPNPEISVDEELRWAYPEADVSFSSWSSESVLKQIESIVFKKYRFQLPAEWSELHIRPIPLLREISKKFGIQWLSRDYAFTPEAAKSLLVPEGSKTNKKSKKNAQPFEEKSTAHNVTFTVEDVVSLNPVVKDSVFRSTVVEEIWEAGRVSLSSGKREEGLALLNEAIIIYEQVYGSIHQDVAKAYSLLAQTYSDLGMPNEAVAFSRRSLRITERTSGIDSFETILGLLNTGYFEQRANSLINAFFVYKAAVDYWSFVYGEDHPSVINTVVNLGSMLQQAELHKESLALFTQALNLSQYVNGSDSVISALIRFQRAQLLTLTNNIAEAVKETKKSYLIYREAVGEDDKVTKETKNWADQFEKYLKHTKLQEKRQREIEAAELKKARQEAAALQKEKANGKKSKSPTVNSNPAIANQSVDDIMKFIEGKAPSKSKKKRGGKK
ncbi:unnamed protein product [Kuraishia capsulata CBS 1993]|uniref:Clu domain-containing protein n=1 Tax=Kuraishia capsulata CBS 1993 TaxID=1382522 RepID=W6ML61_9ASCO|nr:uncharacterized protein KUCA_T00003173001 [Kuraishia capsulata CBS 1993]CDK27196.1 unnamed protein product [Kuraishia capsulata CBS 1993]